MSSKIFIVGANGQLGTALREQYPNARYADIDELDITNQDSVNNFDWSGITTVLNAAAYTNVDGAETPEGRVASWKVNASAVAYLSKACRDHGMTLVHISSDYVFDGTTEPHLEDEPLSPLSVYGASKAAGDLVVEQLDKYYLLRTTWVIGEGKNFVRTMLGLAEKGVKPSVVGDQVGRLTFTSTLAKGIKHLVDSSAPFGTYNLSNNGEPASWADIAKEVYELAGSSADDVTAVTTEEYFAGKEGIAPRPLQSTLDTTKIRNTGFSPPTWNDELRDYMNKEKQATDESA